MKKALPQNLRAFIAHFLRPYKGAVLLYICLAFFAGCWGPFHSILLRYIINVLSSLPAISAGQMPNLSSLTWPAVLLVSNFIILDNVTWRSIGYLNYKFQPVIKNRIIHEMFSTVLGSSYQFFNDRLAGRISSQINILADNIEIILHRIASDLIRSCALLTATLISMYFINPVFFYILALWALLFITLSLYMSKYLVKLSDSYANAESTVSGQLVDSIANANSVRIFARKAYEVCRLNTFLLTTKENFQKKQKFLIWLHIFQGMSIALMFAVMIYFLIHFYKSSLISIGDFALILVLIMHVGHNCWATMKEMDELNQAIGKCKQSLSKLIVPQDVADKEDASNLVVSEGQISFSNVKFHYNKSESLFQKKSVTIKKGQKVGLVGYSGGGKSTFVNLILRLYDVIDGAILIDEHDIRDVTQTSLHQAISMIPQDPMLFHRSLMDNIRYGQVKASDQEVIEASKKANAHEFISQLAHRYDTFVGDRGVKLSGGQRQRIAIARAILKNAPILILDEATSQLDSVTEKFIQKSLIELMQDKTTIVIAHRLSTLLHMQRILVFDQGKIVEDGTHSELLANNKLYKTLWDAQVGGFLPESKIGK